MCGIDQHNNIVRLEGQETLVVLFRFENRTLDRVRVSSLDCQFDAGGLPFVLPDGRPALARAWISCWNWFTPGRRPNESPISIRLITARGAQPRSCCPTARSKSCWLRRNPSRSGRRPCSGWRTLAARAVSKRCKKVLQSDPSDRVREKGHLRHHPQQRSRSHPGPGRVRPQGSQRAKVRSQALFWLAHKAGPQESAVILRSRQAGPGRSRPPPGRLCAQTDSAGRRAFPC